MSIASGLADKIKSSKEENKGTIFELFVTEMNLHRKIYTSTDFYRLWWFGDNSVLVKFGNEILVCCGVEIEAAARSSSNLRLWEQYIDPDNNYSFGETDVDYRFALALSVIVNNIPNPEE